MEPGPPVTFALVQPTEPGNAGAAARSLTAFGFRDLRLIAPAARPGHRDAALAVRWGRETLRAAPIVSAAEAPRLLARFDEVWGTSARRGRHRNLLAAEVAVAAYLEHRPGRLLILFGPERDGLDREWLDRCHRLIRFPTGGGPLNLAHSVTLMAYELRRQIEARAADEFRGVTSGTSPAGEPEGPAESSPPRAPALAGLPLPASPEQRREIVARTEALLAALAYPSRALKRHPPEAYLAPLRSGPLSDRQAQWLLGLLSRLEARLGRD